MNAAHRSRGRVALGLTAAAVGLGLALTGGHPVEPTVAESQDTEYVKTTGQGYWPTYYANIVAGSAKSSVPATNTQNLRYIENLRFRMGNTGTDGGAVGPDQPASSGTYVSRYDRLWRQPGLTAYVDDVASGANNWLTQDPVGNDPHNWKAYNGFDKGGTRDGPQNQRCLYGTATTKPVASDTGRCKIGTGNYTAATNNTLFYGFMWSNGSNYAFLNAANLTTAVRCGPNGGVADAPGGRIDIGEGALNGSDPNLSYDANSGKRWRTVFKDGVAGTGTGTTFSANTLSERWNVSGSNGFMRAMPIIVQKSGVTDDGRPYARSEVGIYAEFYRSTSVNDPGGSTPKNKMYFILSRAECGVRRMTADTKDAALPPAAADLEAVAMPGGNGLTTPTKTTFQPAAQPATRQSMLRRGAPTAFGTPTPADPSIVPTAPTGMTARPEISAPPAVDSPTTPPSSVPGRSEETPASPTSQDRPAPSEPARPGPLAARDATPCSSITVDGEVRETVVGGTSCPADGAAGGAALAARAEDASASDPDWVVFSSSDPESDGWHLAAVSRTTGTVVYLP